MSTAIGVLSLTADTFNMCGITRRSTTRHSVLTKEGRASRIGFELDCKDEEATQEDLKPWDGECFRPYSDSDEERQD